MTTWYVREDATHGGTNTGTSYANAWQGWTAIVWGGAGVVAGDTLYLCGNHARNLTTIGAHGGTSALPVTIRGDYAGDPGQFTISSWGHLDVPVAWSTLLNLTLITTVVGSHAISITADGVRVLGCTVTGGVGGIYAALGAITLYEVIGCHVSGCTDTGIRYMLTTEGSTSSGVTITNNLVHDSNGFGIDVRVTGNTSYINNVKIRNNEVYNTKSSTILFSGTMLAAPDIPTIYSSGLEITGNIARDSGVIAGDNGSHGGLHVTGAIAPLICGNRVTNCYATGAGIQTLRNYNPIICFNYVSGIRAGTPTSLYQNGLPIDGNGIFFDNGTRGGIAYGNYITDLITTGNIGSGAGLSFWDCTNATYYGNIVENVACGAIYGAPIETGNAFYNNTFINCTVGIQKAGGSATTGSLMAKNNILLNCTTGFASYAFPSIVNDYNCVYGSTTAYANGVVAGANDISTNPDIDSNYRPRAVACKKSAFRIEGKDYYGNRFFEKPNLGAVDDIDTPRYLLKP